MRNIDPIKEKFQREKIRDHYWNGFGFLTSFSYFVNSP